MIKNCRAVFTDMLLGHRILKATYTRRSAGGVLRTWNENVVSGYDDDTLKLAENEDFEEPDDWVNIKDKRFMQDIVEEEEKLRRQIRFKTIERKYFKAPQETNFLTWDAKEQIRFLHREFPNEWTVKQIARSFPISEQGVIRLLHSKFYPRSQHEIIKHDASVKKNWLGLEVQGSNGGGAIAHSRKTMLDSGKIQNAAGLKHLPVPERKALLEQIAPKRNVPVSHKTGIFASIVKDYCLQKETGFTREGKSWGIDLLKENSKENSKENKKILDSITASNRKNDTLKDLSCPVSSKPPKIDYLRTFSSRDNTILETVDLEHNSEVDKITNPSHECVDHVNTRVRSLRHKSSGRSRSSCLSHHLEDYGLEGTHKISSFKDEETVSEENIELGSTNKLEQNRTILDESDNDINRKVAQFQRNISQERIRKAIKCDVPKGDNTTMAEPFMYDEAHGYQYPFGRHDKRVKDIAVPSAGKHKKNILFKKGNCYYDEDGTFLYRTP